MKSPAFNTTLLFYPNKNPKLRLFALWYFTALMIVWNILGHTFLGFEQSHAAVFVGIGSAIASGRSHSRFRLLHAAVSQ